MATSNGCIFVSSFQELNYVLKNLLLSLSLILGSSFMSLGQNCSFPGYNLPNSLNYCLGDTLVLSTGLNPAGLTFAWNTGATSPTISLSGGSAGMFWVQVSDGNCSEGDTVLVGVYPSVGLELGNDISACKGESITISPNTSSSLSYSWSNGANSQSINVTQSGIYSVTASNGVCEDSDEIRVTFYDYPSLNLGPDTFICEPTQLTFDLSHQSSAAQYKWYNGSSSPVHIMYADQSKTIYVKASISVCSVVDSLRINLVEAPRASLIRDTILCLGDRISVEAFGDTSWSYEWSNGDSTNVLTTMLADVYTLSVTDEYCTGEQKIKIKEIQKPELNILAPSEICAGEDDFLNATVAGAQYYQWSDGTSDPLKQIQIAGEYIVQVYYECGVLMDTVIVDNCECFVRFPTAFRPMPSAKNQTFGPVSDCEISKYNLSIYNRRGALVFETGDATEFWDGNYRGVPSPSGTYTWTCEYNATENGKNITIEKSGFVTLIQ
jgi:gliding motility-associated-like protein